MITPTQIDLSAWAQTFESTAQWRREKATEFPQDAARHLAAATELDSLAAQFEAGDVNPELVARYEALGGSEQAHRVTEIEGELMRQIGFGRYFEKADDFIRTILDEVRA